MNDRYKTYVFYFSIGLNLALLAGLLFSGMPGEEFEWFEQNHEEEHEEWREFEHRMTALERQTRPLRRRIAKQQKKLLRAFKDQSTDTPTIQAIHNKIHQYQRTLQNRTLEILLKQRRTLSGTARRRVFNRLLKRHRSRYRDLYEEDSDESEDDLDDEEDEIEER